MQVVDAGMVDVPSLLAQYDTHGGDGAGLALAAVHGESAGREGLLQHWTSSRVVRCEPAGLHAENPGPLGLDAHGAGNAHR